MKVKGTLKRSACFNSSRALRAGDSREGEEGGKCQVTRGSVRTFSRARPRQGEEGRTNKAARSEKSREDKNQQNPGQEGKLVMSKGTGESHLERGRRHMAKMSCNEPNMSGMLLGRLSCTILPKSRCHHPKEKRGKHRERRCPGGGKPPKRRSLAVTSRKRKISETATGGGKRWAPLQKERFCKKGEGVPGPMSRSQIRLEGVYQK